MYLHDAAYAGDSELVRYMLMAGADPEFRDGVGDTPLVKAVARDQTKTVHVLLEFGTDVVSLIPKMKRTALHVAAVHNSINAMQVLLSSGADVHCRDRDGFTPLHTAAIDGRTEAAQLLLEVGAEVNARSQRGYTPLYMTAINGKSDTADLLLKSGATVNVEDNNGWIPLYEAVAFGHLTTLLRLLETGSDQGICSMVGLSDSLCEVLDDRTPTGDTILHIAAKFGHIHLVEILLAHGANSRAKNSEGKTPGELASQSGHHYVAIRLQMASP
ncbi:MAG: ankyrin repeat domain-containing protein [Caldilineaceae bacterium]|nr:ankyrin repeat domain-containing protein [Caldilineaceae bacterium]